MNLLKKYYSMSTLEKLDKVDLQILRTLQENARLTTKELAARVSLGLVSQRPIQRYIFLYILHFPIV